MRGPAGSWTWPAVAVALVVVLGSYVFVTARSSVPPIGGTACGVPGGPSLGSEDLTSSLPPSFVGGSIQAFGANSTSVLLGGISYYVRDHQPYDSLPGLGLLRPSEPPVDLTTAASPFFAGGGVFPVGWNGTGWLIAGQGTFGGLTEGTAVAYEGGRFTDLTPQVARYFQGQGIWIAGWDGSGWLLGGNSTDGAALVYLRGTAVTDLTPLLPHNGPDRWVQALGWNGSGWIVGGQGIFGSLHGGRFTDLLPGSPFESGGVFGIDWNGSAWLVGGAPGGALAVVDVSGLHVVPTTGSGSYDWVNSVIADPSGGWLVSGGSLVSDHYQPFLEAATPARSGLTLTNEAACVPASFDGGWVQYAGWAPAYGPRALLLVGEGATDPSNFESHAAASLLFA